jgi:hypothetical protein
VPTKAPFNHRIGDPCIKCRVRYCVHMTGVCKSCREMPCTLCKVVFTPSRNQLYCGKCSEKIKKRARYNISGGE